MRFERRSTSARMMLRLLVLSALATGCTGEGGERGSADPVSRRDSAGVEIVESAAPAWDAETAWRLGSEPRRVLGSETDPLYNVNGSTVLGDSRIAVLDAGNRRVAFFGPDGAFETAIGGEGDGPGEFRTPQSIERLTGDTVRVWDFIAVRLTDLAPDGRLVRTLSLEPTPEDGRPVFVGTFADGRIGVQSYRSPSLEGVDDGDLVRATWRLWIYGAEGEPIDSLGSVPDAARMARIRGEGDQRQIGMVTMPLRNSTPLAAGARSLEAASTDVFELRRFGAGGGVRRIARWAGETRVLTPERFETWLDGLGYEPERIARIREQAEGRLPDRIPPHDRAVVDERGNAWLRVYSLSPELPSEWTVIAAAGEWLGSVELPSRFEPQEIGDDYVIGVMLDELDVEHVLFYDLIKP